jgi:hypothetical protein
MKLSEAILLGSISTKQGFDFTCIDPDCATPCVIGTAMYAVGIHLGSDEAKNNAFSMFWETWPWLRQMVNGNIVRFKHPMKKYEAGVTQILYSLNDTFRWTRPQIAAWVATVEPQEVIETVEQVPVLQEVLQLEGV